MKSLAVKYRPKTFEDVCEQTSTITILKNQIETGTFKSSYLFVGSAGTGKTTCARLFANAINKQDVGSYMEIDAASNSSVEDVRELISQAQTQSITSEYKVIILDECVTGDVEILTDSGFKRFDECDRTEKVAQFNNGDIQFVKPLSWIKNEYHGDLIKWNPRNWCSVRMTPNHVQPLYYTKSKQIKEKYIKDVKFNTYNRLVVSGKGNGSKQHLTPMDRLAIMCQADGTIQHIAKDYVHWSTILVKERKINRLLDILEQGNIPYNEIKTSKGRRFTFDTPTSVTKSLTTHFDLDFSYSGAREFIDEVVAWDGYTTDGYVEYMSTDKANTDFVSAVAVLGGYGARQRIQTDNRKDSYRDIHRVYLYDTNYSGCQGISKTVTTENYDGYVYCVKVPSQQIVIRVNGFVFVTGNCHSFSSKAWQALLKLIEEPPAKTIFIFCTTEAHKVPNTILSRCQRFNFTRISYKGIVSRLSYILDCENATYQKSALEFIAKQADGGMRDAITMLDKCLSYTDNITLDNVIRAIGVSDYDTMCDLTYSLLMKDRQRVIEIIEDMYRAGVDLKQFIKTYIHFILDIVKFYITNDSFDFITIPKTYERWLKQITGDNDYLIAMYEILDMLLKLDEEIKFNPSPKYLIESKFILRCVK